MDEQKQEKAVRAVLAQYQAPPILLLNAWGTMTARIFATTGLQQIYARQQISKGWTVPSTTPTLKNYSRGKDIFDESTA
ncbi:hypothetical protein [Devosia sp.]|uniref:hypothetical protein n=1 Tax=Devosia sp. TaxID=1871048 RepID=UPI002AFDED48|nr:hypothetical protein [Devosia sp.]